METTQIYNQSDNAQYTATLQKYTINICKICEGILFRVGPFLKESIYQDLLIHELNKNNIKTSRETVFGMKFKDSENNDIAICNNQYLRSDIELVELEGIIELKSTTVPTKDEQIWQLRSYLEQRNDRNWGVVINFNHKFSASMSPKIQCDLLFKKTSCHNVSLGNENIQIRQYDKWTFESELYPDKNYVIIEN